MLTEDENIVEIKFAVQYRLNDARAWLFESKNPQEAVVQAAETAGARGGRQDAHGHGAWPTSATRSARACAILMQSILDRYKIGVEVVGINLQQGGVRRPSRCRRPSTTCCAPAQERERAKNEAQAYAMT
jgi:membrane protease subunit HflK